MQDRQDSARSLTPSVVAYSVSGIMMMLKIIVVAPTTAVPMSTGLAVALKVLPAPSFFFQVLSLAVLEVGRVEAEVAL